MLIFGVCFLLYFLKLSGVNGYQGTVAPNSFNSHTNSWCPDFFQKKQKRKKRFCLMSGLKFTLPDVTSFLLDNLFGLKKIMKFMKLTFSKGKLYLRLNPLNNMKTKIWNYWGSLRSKSILVSRFYRMLYFHLVWYTNQKLAWPHIFFCYNKYLIIPKNQLFCTKISFASFWPCCYTRCFHFQKQPFADVLQYSFS